jgi:class 3 adenylate cyclase
MSNDVWREPVRGGFWDPSVVALPGIERVQGMYRGLLPPPPIARLTGSTLTQVSAGSITVSIPTSEQIASFAGLVEPSMVMQPALTLAALTTVGPGKIVEPRTLSVSYARRVTRETGTIVARARVLHTRRNLALGEVVAEDPSGRLIAHATGVHTMPPFAIPDRSPVLERFEEPSYETPDPYLRPVSQPFDFTEELRRRSSLELVEAARAGEIPLAPLYSLMGVRVLDASEGRLAFAFPAVDWLCEPMRTVSGGVISTLLCGLAGTTGGTTAPVGWWLGVLSFEITFIRRLDPDGRDVIIRTAVQHRDEALILVDAHAYDGDGNAIATASITAFPREIDARETARAGERVLATVLFTDIVGSTELAKRLGDAKWTGLLEDHHRMVRNELAIFKGREIKTTGDGFLALFDSPTRAVQCARAVRDDLRGLGVEIKVGLHTGDVELMGRDVGGIAVHIASRVMGEAGPGEVLVSSTVRDLVGGSGIPFDDRGAHGLKGVPDEWRLFALGG